MHRTSFLSLSAFFSIVCHLTFIQFFETYKKKDQEIIVVDLSLFKEFKVEKKLAPTPQKNNEKSFILYLLNTKLPHLQNQQLLAKYC